MLDHPELESTEIEMESPMEQSKLQQTTGLTIDESASPLATPMVSRQINSDVKVLKSYHYRPGESGIDGLQPGRAVTTVIYVVSSATNAIRRVPAAKRPISYAPAIARTTMLRTAMPRV